MVTCCSRVAAIIFFNRWQLLAAAACVSAMDIAESHKLAELEGPLTKDIEAHVEGTLLLFNGFANGSVVPRTLNGDNPRPTAPQYVLVLGLQVRAGL